MKRRFHWIALTAAISFSSHAWAESLDLKAAEKTYQSGEYAAARAAFQPLADQGNAEAEAYMGVMMMTGQGGPQDMTKAVILLRRSAEQGYSSGQVVLGELYEQGLGVEQDTAKARGLFQKAADQRDAPGSEEAALRLGTRYRSPPKSCTQPDLEAEKWLKQAFDAFKKQADAGDRSAVLKLATMYENGWGVAKDLDLAGALRAKSAAVYQALAERGYPADQYHLGQLYARGEGVPKSAVQAAIWYRRASDQGYANAMTALALIYERGLFPGRDSREDIVQSYIWFSIGAKMAPPSLANGGAAAILYLRTNLSASEATEADGFIANWRPLREQLRPDGAQIEMTSIQKAEAERIRREWEPTPAEIETARKAAYVDDIVVGKPAAKITLIEYTSAACEHCARFDAEVFPEFRTKYIDKGVVRFVVRQVLIGQESYSLGGALLTQCVAKDKRFDILEALYREQPKFVAPEDAQAWLAKAALSRGIKLSQVGQCLNDQHVRQSLLDRNETIERFDGIDSAPTFQIGQTKLIGRQSMVDLDRVLSAAEHGAILPAETLFQFERQKPVAAGAKAYLKAVVGSADVETRQPDIPSTDQIAEQADGSSLRLGEGFELGRDIVAGTRTDKALDGSDSIVILLTDAGRARLAALTTRQVGQQIAFVVGDQIISAPRVMTPITGCQMEVTGSRPDLAAMMQSLASINH